MQFFTSPADEVDRAPLATLGEGGTALGVRIA